MASENYFFFNVGERIERKHCDCCGTRKILVRNSEHPKRYPGYQILSKKKVKETGPQGAKM